MPARRRYAGWCAEAAERIWHNLPLPRLVWEFAYVSGALALQQTALKYELCELLALPYGVG